MAPPRGIKRIWSGFPRLAFAFTTFPLIRTNIRKIQATLAMPENGRENTPWPPRAFLVPVHRTGPAVATVSLVAPRRGHPRCKCKFRVSGTDHAGRESLNDCGLWTPSFPLTKPPAATKGLNGHPRRRNPIRHPARSCAQLSLKHRPVGGQTPGARLSQIESHTTASSAPQDGSRTNKAFRPAAKSAMRWSICF